MGRLLEPQGFELSYCSSVSEQHLFFRVGKSPGLFERIRLHFGKSRSARDHNCAYVVAEVAVVPGWTAVRGLYDERLLRELEGPEGGGWRRFSSEKDEMAFAESVSTLGPVVVSKIAAESGPEILSRTESARAAVEKYLGRLHNSGSTGISGLDEMQIDQAHKILSTPGVMRIPDGSSAYETAIATILTFSDEVDGQQVWSFDSSPFRDLELLWRIEILASRIYGESGWFSVPPVFERGIQNSES